MASLFGGAFLMAIISFHQFEDDTVVLHFGGQARSMDAYTFAEALVGFANASIAINTIVDPGTEIELVVEATGPGSFRAVIRRIKKGYGGLLYVGGTIFWGVVTNVIYDATLKNDPKPEIIVNTNEVIIRHGNDTVIVPRQVYVAAESAKKNPAVQRGISRAFAALEADEKVTDFGIANALTDREPLIRIPRAEFPKLVNFIESPDRPSKERFKKERARLVVLKAWLNHSKRKWSFEWNGVPIAAPIDDSDFLDRLDRREILFGSGDALDADVAYRQIFDPSLEVYVNDLSSFVVTQVVKVIPRQ